jgi:hypothetical protein
MFARQQGSLSNFTVLLHGSENEHQVYVDRLDHLTVICAYRENVKLSLNRSKIFSTLAADPGHPD